MLDGQLHVLDRAVVTGGRCSRGRWRSSDPRLFVLRRRAVWMSYVNEWGDTPCRGHYVAELTLELRSKRAGSAQRLAARLAQQAGGRGGVDVTGAPRPMASPRNGGVIVSHARGEANGAS